MKSSSSSEATPQTSPIERSARINVSFAKTSSFIWFSPWTFSEPAKPKISASPALLISRLTTLAAKRIDDSNCESSPVA